MRVLGTRGSSLQHRQAGSFLSFWRSHDRFCFVGKKKKKKKKKGHWVFHVRIHRGRRCEGGVNSIQRIKDSYWQHGALCNIIQHLFPLTCVAFSTHSLFCRCVCTSKCALSAQMWLPDAGDTKATGGHQTEKQTKTPEK